MNIKAVTQKSRESGFDSIDATTLQNIKFAPIGEEQQIGAKDKNRKNRYQFIEALLEDYTISDIDLIRFLTKEEIKATKHDLEHCGLAQLCFYLFSLAQKEDVFLIYEAKFKTGCMDASIMVDREMLKMQHKKAEMVSYVNSKLTESPEIREKYSNLMEELINIYENPDYESAKAYLRFISGYYYRHENIKEINGELKVKKQK